MGTSNREKLAFTGNIFDAPNENADLYGRHLASVCHVGARGLAVSCDSNRKVSLNSRGWCDPRGLPELYGAPVGGYRACWDAHTLCIGARRGQCTVR